MSDALRQDTGDKLASNLKPDSQKTTTEQAGDKVKGAADSVAGSLQPQGEKSATQKASDAVSGSDDAGKQGDSLLNQASETLSNAATSAQNALGLGGEKK